MLQQLHDFTMKMKVNEHFGWQYLYKINKLLVGVFYPLFQYGKRKNGLDEKSDIIVSLTSYPARIKTVWITISSLLEQTKKPQKVILWLAQAEFPKGEEDLPKNLLKLKKRGLEIRFRGDLRSHKKYYYAMKEYPEKYIVTFDDDMIYPPKQIERLWNKHLEYPECVCCHYGHAVSFDEKGNMKEYDEWREGDRGYTVPSMVLVPVGCNGVLYPPHALIEEAFDVDAIKECSFSTDDLWLKCMSVLNDVPAVSCNEGAMLCFSILQTRETGLYLENIGLSKNDISMKKIIEKYPVIMEKLRSECHMKPKKKVLVVHPGKQHSLRLAEALERSGMLFGYATTMYDKHGTVTHGLTKLLRGKNKKKAQGRKSNHIPDEKVVVLCEMTGLIGRFLDRILPYPGVYYRWNDYLNNKFGKKAAKYACKHHVDAVISFDNNSDIVFKVLKEKAPEIVRIMDVSSVNRIYMKEIYEKDVLDGGVEGLKKEQYILWDEKTLKRIAREIKNTQYFLTPTEVVADSLIYSDVSKEKIYKAPYGVDIEKFQCKSEIRKEKKAPLQLIYVGYAGYKKGCHHLLKWISEYDSKQVVLKIAGDYNQELYNEYKNATNIEFLGFVTRDRLMEHYQMSDAYIMTSIGEGMGMAAIEALACGIPVLCTELSGVKDVIIDGKNGFVVPAQDKVSMKEKIDWMIENRESVWAMSACARKTAEELTWEAYYSKVMHAINRIFEASV